MIIGSFIITNIRARRSTRSRQDWIEAAIAALEVCGVEALRIDDLAENLGVTKGSFYYHFDTRDELLIGILEYWRLSMTREVESFILSSVGTPSGQIKRLIRIALAPRSNVPGGPLELRLREWAHRNSKVAEIVKEVDGCRIAFLAQLYEKIGFSLKRAAILARIHMAHVIGMRILLEDHDKAEFDEAVEAATEFLLPDPKTSENSDEQ